jgi:hypothetical protein
MRCCRWIVDSLRSTRCEERSYSRIPPDPNKTSAMARHTPTQYSSDNNLKNKELFNTLKHYNKWME